MLTNNYGVAPSSLAIISRLTANSLNEELPSMAVRLRHSSIGFRPSVRAGIYFAHQDQQPLPPGLEKLLLNAIIDGGYESVTFVASNERPRLVREVKGLGIERSPVLTNYVSFSTRFYS